MGTHYHLLLALAMQGLNSRYARRFNERHRRGGHVFAERLSARVIVDERHFGQAYEYLEANPGKAGLCDGDEPRPCGWIETRGRDDRRHGRVPVPRAESRAERQ